MKIKLLAVAAALLIPGCLLSQVDQRPVPPNWIHEGKLVVPAFNFSIKSPNPNSRWTYTTLPKSEGYVFTMFLGEVGDGSKYVVLVSDGGRKFGARDQEGFVKGMTRSMPKDWTVADTHFESSGLPVEESTRFRVAYRLPNSTKLFAYGYVITGRRNYMLMNYSDKIYEPPEFTSFVGTFTRLTPEPPDQTGTTNGFILLSAFCGAIFDWWYMRKGGRKPVRNDYLGLLVVVLLMVALFVLYGYRGADAGEMGAMTVDLLILVFGIWELSRWIIRRKYPRPSTKPL
jgi:hypothetical protein